MGKIRQDHIKKTTEKLMEMHKDKFTEDFDENKVKVEELVNLNSKTMRNRIAGYITKKIRSSN